MAPPFPPHGDQKQYTERPLKIYGEQCVAGGPLPVGVQTTAPGGATTPPYVIDAAGRYWPVPVGAWVVSSRYSGAVLEVLSDEEFTERFGGGGGPTSLPTGG
jgi:hypothetical protein